MKKILPVLLLFVAQAIHAQVQADTYATASRTKSGKVTYIYNDVFGYTQHGANGQVTGLLVEVMEEFEKYVKAETGIALTHEYKFMQDDFTAFMQEVKESDGGVFGLGNVSVNEERKKQYLFSPAFLRNISIVVTNAGVSPLASEEAIKTEFKDKVAYSISASTYNARIDEIKNKYLPDLEVKYYTSSYEIMDILSKDKNAFAVLDLNFYIEALSKKYPIKRHPVCDRVDDDFAIIMPKSNDWQPLLTAFFKSGFLQSSSYNQIIVNNLGNSALKLARDL